MSSQYKEKIAISIVTYQAIDYFKKCIDSLEWTKSDDNIKILIFDNSENNEIQRFVNTLKDYNIEFEKSQSNLGFGAGHNANYSKVAFWNPKYFLILNPDLTISKSSFDIILDQFTDTTFERVGIVAPRLIDASTNVENSVLVDPNVVSLTWSIFKDFIGLKPSHEMIPSTNEAVKGVSGALMLINVEMIQEIGFFDSEYFMYHEDNDLCYRARQNGWTIVFTPKTEATHFLGKSSDENPAKKQWLTERMYISYLIYFKKNKGALQTRLLKTVWILSLYLRILLNKDREFSKDLMLKVRNFRI